MSDCKEYDLVVIGSGPAGMAAVNEAGKRGIKTLILDEQPCPGGQIYRNINSSALVNRTILGAEYYEGEKLLEGLKHSAVDYVPCASVWEVAEDNSVFYSKKGISSEVLFKKLILATGAQERPAPFPGWTIPGVMTCGAAQILLKSSGLVPSQPLVIAGSGPLLLLVTCQLLRAGVPVEGVVDTTPIKNYCYVFSEVIGVLRGLPYLFKGIDMLREIRMHKTAYYMGASQLKAESDSSGNLDYVSFKSKKREYHLPCSSLLVHQGVIPNTQITRAIGLKHQWDEVQQCWKPSLKECGKSSHKDIWVAGDSAGIGGAQVAVLKGRLASLSAIEEISSDSTVKEQKTLRKEIGRQLAVRPFLDRLYQPLREFLSPEDETIICRCEEIKAKEVREMVRLGCRGPNQVKAFCRVGMGPCQGRQCGSTVTKIIADELCVSMKEVGFYTVRTPIKPLTLGELASLASPVENI